MALTRDDIDAVSMTLQVDGDPAFMILLTRGGLTKRRGSSDRQDPDAPLTTGRTDSCFEDLMAALPESLLAGDGGVLDDGSSARPRHEWRFELGGGMASLTYDVAYHADSASLPDEFADMVARAEKLTHSWYAEAAAQERGEAPPQPTRHVPPPPPKQSAPAASQAMGRAGQALTLTRERLALAIALDFAALSVPYAFLHWLIVGPSERVGPPGAGLMLFAIAEFVLLQIVRKSPGYWLLGVSAPHGSTPVVEPGRAGKESPVSLALGTALCVLGVGGLTAWTIYNIPVPYFGLAWPIWLSIPLTLLGGLALLAAGALVLRLDMRGVWLGGGLGLLMLLAALVGWGEWGGFVERALAERAAYLGRPVASWARDLAGAAVPFLALVVPALLVAGAVETWRRLGRRPAPVVRAAPTRS